MGLLWDDDEADDISRGIFPAIPAIQERLFSFEYLEGVRKRLLKQSRRRREEEERIRQEEEERIRQEEEERIRQEEEERIRQKEERIRMNKEWIRMMILAAVRSSTGNCTLQHNKALTKQKWFNDSYEAYEAFEAKYKDVTGGIILPKDVQALYGSINILKPRVQQKTEKILKKNQITDTIDPALKERFDIFPKIDHEACYYNLRYITSTENDVLAVIATYEILLFIYSGLECNDALLNTVLLLAKLQSLVDAIVISLLSLKTKKGQGRVVLVSWFYKVIKFVLWTCGDVEKNPGPPSTKSAQGYAKTAAMRELTPILCKLINNLPVMCKAPNGLYRDKKYKPAGFKMELLDPNNNKTLATTKKLEEQLDALVKYCNERKIYVPDKYMFEIQALQSKDFASLEMYRAQRHMEEKFYECQQIAVNHGPEGINHLLKITENFNILFRKKCDETVAENQNNKRKRELNSNNERNMKRLCTDSLNQKRNETVTSSNHIDPNPIQRVPDILNQTDDLNDTKEKTTGADTDPVVNDVGNMRNGDKLMATSESIDIDALEVTTSAQADNPPSTSDANGGSGTNQACSSSNQGTNCDQNIPSNSDENDRISTDDLGNLFPDFLDADDIFEDFQKF